MIPVPVGRRAWLAGVAGGRGWRAWLAAGVTDLGRGAWPRWRREGETALGLDPYAGHPFVFAGPAGRPDQGDLVGRARLVPSGRRSDRWRARPSIARKLERGRFVWPAASEGKVAMTPARLAMLPEG